MEIKKVATEAIFFRDSEAAFDNAASQGFDFKDTHMYMYTTSQGFDMFKNILTRLSTPVALDD